MLLVFFLQKLYYFARVSFSWSLRKLYHSSFHSTLLKFVRHNLRSAATPNKLNPIISASAKETTTFSFCFLPTAFPVHKAARGDSTSTWYHIKSGRPENWRDGWLQIANEATYFKGSTFWANLKLYLECSIFRPFYIISSIKNRTYIKKSNAICQSANLHNHFPYQPTLLPLTTKVRGVTETCLSAVNANH